MPDALQKMLSTPTGWLIFGGIIVMILMTNACHEGGHALVAWWCGDRRESIRRRASLNPIKHFHWFLTLVLPLLSLWFLGFVLGGAKPVMLDKERLGPRGLALAALAGPLGNFLFAGFVIAVLGFLMGAGFVNDADVVRSTAWRILKPAVWFSVFLGLLNLLPIPPLDGSRVVHWFLPEKLRTPWLLLAPVGIIVIVVGGLWLSGQLERFGFGRGHPEIFVAIETRMETWLFAMSDFWKEIL